MYLLLLYHCLGAEANHSFFYKCSVRVQCCKRVTMLHSYIIIFLKKLLYFMLYTVKKDT